MKKIGIFLLTLATVFSIAGCKKKNKTTKGNNTSTVDPSSYITPDVEGNMLENGNFNYSEVEYASSGDQLIKTENGGEWWCYALNGGFGQIKINDKRQLEVGVVMTADKMHCIQLAYDGFAITKGSKYTLEFDAYCTIDRSFEIRIQQNGGTYENYILEGQPGNLIDRLGTEMKHYKYDFTSAVTDVSPRLALNLGWFEGDPKYMNMAPGYLDIDKGEMIYDFYEVMTFDNFVLKCTYDSGVVVDPLDLDSRSSIRLNQVGFKPNQTKMAVIRADKATMPTQCLIIDATTNEQVLAVPVKGEKTNKSSLEYTGYIDFSSLVTPGTYKVRAGSLGESSEFVIADDAYTNITEDVIMMLYRQRCGEVLGPEGDKFTHDACHQAKAYIYGTTTEIDVSGGWHDAGDYGKYVVAGAQTVADLLSAFKYGNGDAFTYPSYVGNDATIPDILEEAMWELDWMLKMQASNGQVYHKVSTKEFPTNNVKPQDDHGTLYVSPTSYAATADFAAVMAMATRILNEEGIAATKAEAYEEAAIKAYAALASMSKTSFKNPDDIKTGEYPDSQLNDELAWASIELYGLTNDESYLTAFRSSFDSTYDLGLGWANVNGFAAVEAIDILFESGTTLSDSYKAILEAFLEYADELVDNAKADAYAVSIGTKIVDGKEVYVFDWGSNLTVASNGRILHTASMIVSSFGSKLGFTEDECVAKYNEYYKYMELQLNYLLGQNACAYCFVTGYGELSPENPHHRPSIAAGEAMPGMLIGGPDSNFAENGNDSVATRNCKDAAPAHCYIDNDNSWSTNEITIYWNSPLIYLLLAV